MVELKGFFDLVDGGVGLGFVVYGVVHARVAQRLFEWCGEAVFHDAAVGYHEHGACVLLRKNGAQIGARANDFGLAVGEHREHGAKADLKDAAVGFFKEEHGNYSFLGAVVG